MVYCANPLSIATLHVDRCSDHRPDIGLFSLRGATYLANLVGSGQTFSNHAWCRNVHSGDCSICQAIPSNVPCYKAVANQSVLEPPYETGYPLFLYVRPRLILPSLLPSKRANHLTELMLTFPS